MYLINLLSVNCNGRLPSYNILCSAATKMVTSKPWSVEYHVKPTPASTMLTNIQPKGTEIVTTENVAGMKMEGFMRGVKQGKVELDESPLKGFAVVEKEHVPYLYREFEEIFVLNK